MSKKGAVARIVEWARFQMATHDEHCDCDCCAAFFDLDYPTRRAPSAEKVFSGTQCSGAGVTGYRCKKDAGHDGRCSQRARRLTTNEVSP